MAPPKRPWFRFYVETFSDVEMRVLPPAQRWTWAAVLGLARMSPVPGALLDKAGLPVAEAFLAEFAAVKPADVRAAFKRFTALEMVARDTDGTWLVLNWDKRQFESDDVASRTAKHRSMKQGRNVPSNGDGTANGTANPSVEHSEVQSSTDTSSQETTPPLVVPVPPPAEPLPARLSQPGGFVELVDPRGPLAVRREATAVLNEASRRCDGPPLMPSERKTLGPFVQEALAGGYPSADLAQAIADSPFRTPKAVLGQLRMGNRKRGSVGDDCLDSAASWVARQEGA
jgi:hypothetical protein